MAAVAHRANPLFSRLPHFLTWRSLGFRTICSGRMGFSSRARPEPEPETPTLPGTKLLETFTEQFEIGSRLITLETGKIARFANGAVVLGVDETRVLSTVCSANGGAVKDFLPLTVDYQEKQFAQGVIPNTFMRREGAPKERELLCGRLIDRPIRPLFPAGFFHEVQVTASILSSDGKQDPDVLAANAASAALMLSDIPWAGPIGMIRIGRIEGKFIVNPTMDELSLSDLNLVYACTRDKTLMIDVQAREISERDLEAGLRLAHPEAVKYLEPQIRLAAKAGKHKKEYKLSLMPERTLEKVAQLAEAPIEEVFTDPKYGKFERGEALENITQDVRKALEEECDEESLRLLPKAVDTVRKKVVRKRIIAEGSRLDGRRLDEVRPVYCESGNLPRLHGSSLFSRGDTQVLCTVTLGAPGDAQRLESVVGPPSKRFMLHYSFPPFCINEVGKHGGLNRREVGHGTLAEKALLAVLPPEDEFPYTVRINSEVMSSDGSTSMASVCGGSMALMDAGIPLRKHVAGVSVGLVSEVDQSTGTIREYRILTDILGLEDHLGDMDFKIVGTEDGITAIQLDIKPAGIPLDIVCESLEAARKGRIQILDHMEREISAPRTQDDRNSPRLATLKYSNDSLRRLLGPMGALKRKIEDETGTRMSVSDGILTIVAKNQSSMDKVVEKVDFILGREIEIGGVYKGTVASIKEYGAFVEFNGGQAGLLHISELSHEPVSRISDVVSVGQQLSLRCIGQDIRGNIKLSLKATLPQPQSQANDLAVSVPSLKQAPSVWAAGGDVSKGEEKHSPLSEELPVSKYEVNGVKSSTSSSSPVLVRSVEECDEEERSTGFLQKSKTTAKPIGGRKPEHKTVQTTPKTSKSISRKKGDKDDVSKEEEKHSSFSEELQVSKYEANGMKSSTCSSSRVLVRSVEECDEEERSTGFIQKSKPTAKPIGGWKPERKTVQTTPETSKSISRKKGDKYEKEQNIASQTHSSNDLSNKEELVTAKSLKLGTKVTAKVYQVRTGGLVLDLGGGLRGMYRFKANAKDFDINDELRVECVSFSSKGIPVMSLVDDEWHCISHSVTLPSGR
ncbi:polyribonucleotide nucleotidyltransferase 2, mitochondrial [Argentina anserina]|uniref:polyribonucleotide nucleotidyltransferase 2, mitochondrial n=1 Tax=Argentina anserina TaxID=57926 RepID=UPI00217632EC|nr:polyribonucleotide nucleotidyltransferase 2, mitochondrial [Potentilla anserina]